MGFHKFIKVNMIGQLCISINDTGKTMRKYQKKFLPTLLLIFENISTIQLSH